VAAQLTGRGAVGPPSTAAWGARYALSNLPQDSLVNWTLAPRWNPKVAARLSAGIAFSGPPETARCGVRYALSNPNPNYLGNWTLGRSPTGAARTSVGTFTSFTFGPVFQGATRFVVPTEFALVGYTVRIVGNAAGDHEHVAPRLEQRKKWFQRGIIKETLTDVIRIWIDHISVWGWRSTFTDVVQRHPKVQVAILGRIWAQYLEAVYVPDIERWSSPGVRVLNTDIVFGAEAKRTKIDVPDTDPSAVSLLSSEARIFERAIKDAGGSSSNQYRSDINPEAPPIPLGSALPFGLLLCGGYAVIVAYVLKRADYTIPIGIIGAWPIFALGFSFISYQRCPSFLEPLYSPLPICQYEAP